MVGPGSVSIVVIVVGILTHKSVWFQLISRRKLTAVGDIEISVFCGELIIRAPIRGW